MNETGDAKTIKSADRAVRLRIGSGGSERVDPFGGARLSGGSGSGGRWQSIVFGGFGFFCVCVAFCAMFYFFAAAATGRLVPLRCGNGGSGELDANAAGSATEGRRRTVLIYNESGEEIAANAVVDEAFSLAPFMVGDGAEVAVFASHPHEMISQSKTVGEAADEVAAALRARGIGAIRVDVDAGEVIYAYRNTAAAVAACLEAHPYVVCALDVHSSDTPQPLTFTVGTENAFGWRENLYLAGALCARTANATEPALRVTPASLAQDLGVLSVHVGIGGADFDDDESSFVLGAFVAAFASLCAPS